MCKSNHKYSIGICVQRTEDKAETCRRHGSGTGTAPLGWCDLTHCRKSMVRNWFITRHDNPYIYVPNLIGELITTSELVKGLSHFPVHRWWTSTASLDAGYLRISSSLLAFAVALKSPSACVSLYTFGCAPCSLPLSPACMLRNVSSFVSMPISYNI